jgi:hypothetical protein
MRKSSTDYSKDFNIENVSLKIVILYEIVESHALHFCGVYQLLEQKV